MNKVITICLMLLAISSMAIAGPAGVDIIDPDTGWIGYFAWQGGLGQMDDLSFTEYSYDWVETEWKITLECDGWIDLVTVDNDYVPGDAFEMYVDGGLVTWTSEYYDGSGFYHGEKDDLFLTAGTHTIYMSLTALAPGYTTGAAHADFSAVTYIPAPGAILLGSIGVGLVGWLRRKRAL